MQKPKTTKPFHVFFDARHEPAAYYLAALAVRVVTSWLLMG